MHRRKKLLPLFILLVAMFSYGYSCSNTKEKGNDQLSDSSAKSSMFGETDPKSFEGKALKYFLEGPGGEFDEWFPMFEEVWIVGCHFVYGDSSNTDVIVMFQQPTKVRWSDSLDWKIEELLDVTIESIDASE